jgi:hypothetical protein
MLIIVATMFVVLFAFLAGGLWIGWTLAVTGTLLLAIFRDIPLDKLLAQYAWNILTTQELLALPLFILMGEILFRTRLSHGRRCCRGGCCTSTSSAARSSPPFPARRPPRRRWSAASRSPNC